jgi:uncharacterized phage-associated protein
MMMPRKDDPATSVLDVAAYVLRGRGPMTAMKLQKLVYYAQAWSLAWTGRALFYEAIEAWQLGPVVRTLYRAHRGMFSIAEIPAGNPNSLAGVDRQIVDAIISHYGRMSPSALSDLTHEELPWRLARGNAAPNERSEGEISRESIAAFYRSNPTPRAGVHPSGETAK